MSKKRDFDVIGILLGVVIGILIGYFISTRLNINDETVLGSNVIEEEVKGYVYLLQLAKFDNPDGALNYVKTVKNKGLNAEAVYDGQYYYIYGAISGSESDLEIQKAVFEATGYTTIVKKEYLIDKANRVLDDQEKYEFWLEGINNLINCLKDEDILISDKYYSNPIDLEFFSTMTILQTIQNEEIKAKVKLQAYRMISENLS